ncbi:hypothetical protein ACFSM7_08470 [Clavibacter michiganensis subsp. tessellarius]|uniref:hypothetical protein n=1 Tax=Clavibacter tessellarius TaxID=31965 RepID=UPI0036398338
MRPRVARRSRRSGACDRAAVARAGRRVTGAFEVEDVARVEDSPVQQAHRAGRSPIRRDPRRARGRRPDRRQRSEATVDIGG